LEGKKMEEGKNRKNFQKNKKVIKFSCNTMTVTGGAIGAHIIRESGLSLFVWGPSIQSNPYCICQFPNLINYHQQTLRYQQLVDDTMVLSTVGW
jgi:hypothetical protein